MDEAKFSEIVEQSKKVVLAAVYRYLSPVLKDYIDDIVQETYFKAYRRLSKVSIDEIHSLDNYMFTIAKNEAIRFNIKEKKVVETSRELSTYDEDLYDPQEDDQKVSVRLVLKDAPEPYKHVLTMFVDGFSILEIGEKLDLKSGTVKSKLFRGREWVKTEYKRREKQYET
jgi:RNA polymerase sigma-70 factor, ECF subfamily